MRRDICKWGESAYAAELTDAVRAHNLEQARIDPSTAPAVLPAAANTMTGSPHAFLMPVTDSPRTKRRATTKTDSPRTNRAAAMARALGPSPSMPFGPEYHAFSDSAEAEDENAQLLELQLAMQLAMPRVQPPGWLLVQHA